jgi:peptidoglycan/xylan/chitin deacetylase (PgdA/CDA1 family)
MTSWLTMHEYHASAASPRANAPLLSRRAVLAGAAAMAATNTARSAAPSSTAGIPILAYHRFDPSAPAPTTVTMGTFQSQLDILARLDFRIVPLRQAVDTLHAPRTAAGRQAVITVDDGHRSVYEQLFPMIRRLRLPVTLFVYPSAISNASYAMTWEQLRELRASGLIDIQSHTYWHPNFLTEQRKRGPKDYAAFVDDQLVRSRRTIAERVGGTVNMLAWPFGIVDPVLEAAAHSAGYAAGFAYAGGPAKPGGDLLALPRMPIGEGDRGRAFARRLGLDWPEARP